MYSSRGNDSGNETEKKDEKSIYGGWFGAGCRKKRDAGFCVEGCASGK